MKKSKMEEFFTMEKTEFTRSIDELGRIVLPVQMREKLEAVSGDCFDITLENGAIILRKSEKNS